MRADEIEVPVRLGDAPPTLPFRKPFDLSPWQLVGLLAALGCTLNLDQFARLSDGPLEPDAPLSPMLIARLVVLTLGLALVFISPCERSLLVWAWVAFCHFARGLQAVYDDESGRGTSYYQADAAEMTRMHLHGNGTIFVVDPPHWWLMRWTPTRDSYRAKHVCHRMLLPIEAQGSLGLMTDDERAAKWSALAGGLRALKYPTQIVSQARREDPDWLVARAVPPRHSPFAAMREPIEAWAREKATKLTLRRIAVVCSAPDEAQLVEHVRDVQILLTETGLLVRELELSEQRDIFRHVYGKRRFYPHSTDSYGVDDIDWVTVQVRRFPSSCVVGWVMYVIAQLPVDVGLYIEPDDGKWVTRQMEWFQGMCDLQTADTAHKDAFRDCARVEGKLKRGEDSVQRTTLLLTMPRAAVPRVMNRLGTAGAVANAMRFEHQGGRLSTLPVGGLPRVGFTRPYDGASVAACFPFGADGLRTDGILLGTARTAPEAVTLDLLDEALNASMVAILGTTGAGKTVLIQLLLLRSGLPFVVIDMKPHRDETRHGDFYRLVMEAQGNYHVCRAGEPLPTPHPFAQAYNLASVPDRDKPAILEAIAEQEWQRAVDSLEDRIFAMDEAYWLGKTPAGQDFIERIVSQGRSVGFIGIAASQEVGDFLNERRLAKAVTMSSVQFVLAQEHSAIPRVVRELQLGGEAAAELAKFQPAPGDKQAVLTRSALMRVGRRMVSLRIEASPAEMAMMTTRPADKRAVREEVLA